MTGRCYRCIKVELKLSPHALVDTEAIVGLAVEILGQLCPHEYGNDETDEHSEETPARCRLLVRGLSLA